MVSIIISDNDNDNHSNNDDDNNFFIIMGFINIFQTSCHLQVKNSNIKISKAQNVIITIIIIIVISYMS